MNQPTVLVVKKDGYQGELFIENPEKLQDISTTYKNYKTISFYSINMDISYVINTDDIDDIQARMRAIETLPLPFEQYPMFRMALLDPKN